MISFKEIDDYLKAAQAAADQPFENDLQRYSLKGKTFAYIGKNSRPLRISLRLDQALIRHLSEKYESVMSGHKLDPDKWATLLVTGQLTDREILDLADRSIHIAKSGTED